MKISRFVIRALCLLGLWLGLGLQAHAQTDTVTYVYTDPQGTPLVEADASGNIVARYDYTPYGSSVASLGNPPNGPGYTGHVNDPETGLVYMQARYYQPTGRFLSPDPEEPTPGNIFDFNRYSYVDNNPIIHTDPTGRQCAQCLYSPNDSLEHQAAILQTADARALEGTASLLPVVGSAISIYQAATAPTALSVSTAAVSIIPEVGGVVADALKGASAVERATAIAGTMSERTQRSVTIAVTETKEGTRVVSSSEGALRPAARAGLADGEVAAKGVAGVHAEVNGINAARDMGLTPTGSAASRPICPSCAQQLEQQGVKPLSPLKQPGS